MLQTHDVISVGAFRLFPSHRLLMKGDQVVKLGSRAFDILLTLAERPGQVVSQSDLLARAWPGLFVEDVSLRFQIAALRKVLESSTDGTRYLANIPGRGYSLIAPIQQTTIEDIPEQARVTHSTYTLPPPLVGMVGRDDQVREIREKLMSTRFVSIVGPGGVGKTTVARSIAHTLLQEFFGAVCFVELSPVGDLGLLAAAITSAFGLPVHSEDPVPDLVAYLRERRVLLVLDSCEHLISEAASLAQRLFDQAPSLHILVTSREALRAEAEHQHFLPSLASPPKDGGRNMMAYPATQLFVDRMVRAGFGHRLSDEDAVSVAEICRRLGGIPLAIELAAGRASALGIRDIASLINSQFALQWPGRRTGPPRHQTLNATLDWSYGLLPEIERTVFRRLATFSGSFTLEAAQRVACENIDSDLGLEAFDGLVAKFLVTADTSGAISRYRLLDTTRAYARKKLEDAGERQSLARRHALYCYDLLRSTAGDEVAGDKPTASAADIDDIRAALQWAFESADGDELVGADIAASSAPLWLSKALLAECRKWLAKAARLVDSTSAPGDQQLRIQISLAATELFTSGITKETLSAWNKTLARAKAVGDAPAQLLSYLILWGGEVRAAQYSEALATAEKCAAVAEAAGDAGSLAQGEWMIGHSKHCVGRFNESRARLEMYLQIETQAARLASIRATGFDRRVDALSVLSNTLWILGRPDQARAGGERAVVEARSLGFAIATGLAMECAGLNTYLCEPDLDVIEREMVDLLEHGRTHSIMSNSGLALAVMGLVQAKRGQFDAGTRMIAEGLQVLAGASLETFSMLVRAHACEAAINASRLDEAQHWQTELDTKDPNPEHWCSAEILRVRGLLAQARGDEIGAAEHLSNAIALARRQEALSWELRSAVCLSRLRATQNHPAEALMILDPVFARFREGHCTSDLITARLIIDELNARRVRSRDN